ncbi:MAG TPA: DUF1080 domain-containing protein [Verrucomicrobiae bacterium]
MTTLKCLFGLVSGCVLLGSVFAAEPAKKVSLFDGKTFTGWEGDTSKSFRIQDGAIVGGNLQTAIPRNEFLCTTRQYTNFVLRAKFKLLGGEKANAGIQFRTQRIPNHHEVIGYQADMGQQYWGALYDESRRKRILAGPAKEEIPQFVKTNDWNEYEIRCEGARIQLLVNGKKTVDYTEEDATIPRYGIIAVQIHSGPPTEAWYKDITIEELP